MSAHRDYSRTWGAMHCMNGVCWFSSLSVRDNRFLIGSVVLAALVRAAHQPHLDAITGREGRA